MESAERGIGQHLRIGAMYGEDFGAVLRVLGDVLRAGEFGLKVGHVASRIRHSGCTSLWGIENHP